MKQRQNLIEQLFQKLFKEQNSALKIWKRASQQAGVQKQINCFLEQFMQEHDFSFLLENSRLRSSMEIVLARLNSNKLKQTLGKERLSMILTLKTAEAESQNRKRQQLRPNDMEIDLPKEQVIEEYFDNEINLEVVTNSNMLSLDYQCMGIRLKEQFQIFLSKYIYREIFSSNSQKLKLRILNFTKQLKDQSTGIYIFDSFFNAVKIFISRKNNQPFGKKFKILKAEDSSEINFSEIFKTNNSSDFWVEESSFNSEESVNGLIDYVCQKQNADTQTKQYLKKLFYIHSMKKIRHLYTNPKQFCQKIEKIMWSQEFLLLIERLRAKEKAQKWNIQRQKNPRKRECFQVGNSHKILRFLFMKNNNDDNEGLEELKKHLPLINPKNMEDAFQIISKQMIMPSVFEQLKIAFKPFTVIPEKGEEEKLQIPYGMLFHGPPGTGKTRLTEDLVRLMGFHLISIGLSSADFQKQLVGQSKGMIQSLFNRPSESEYLACSIAIDEIDALVSDRRKKESKNSESVAMLLSILGGNKAVNNILVLGSTNFRSEIDPAINRRLCPSFYIGLPNQASRALIIKKYLYIKFHIQEQINFAASITPNFSGNALKAFANQINQVDRWKFSHHSFKREMIKHAEMIANFENILFGKETFPSLISRSKSMFRHQVFSQKNVIIVKKHENSLYQINYQTKSKKWLQNEEQSKYQDYHQIISTNIRVNAESNRHQVKNHFQSFISWLDQSFKRNLAFQYQPIQVSNLQFCEEYFHKNHLKAVFLIIRLSTPELIIFQSNMMHLDVEKTKNLFVILYNQNLKFEGMNERKSMNRMEEQLDEQVIDVREQFDAYVKPQVLLQEMMVGCIKKKSYTGKVLVDISKKTPLTMEFQLTKKYDDIELQNIPIFHKETIAYAKDVLPLVVDHFIPQNLDYILLINFNFFAENNCHQDQQANSLICQKFKQFKNYQKSAVFIFLDEIITFNRKFSNENSKKKNQNDDITLNSNTKYQSIINNVKNLDYEEGKGTWIVFITENEIISKSIKDKLNWPENGLEKEIKFKQKEEENEKQRRKKDPLTCQYCQQHYIREQNMQEKKCRVHYGYLVDSINYELQNQLKKEDAAFEQHLHNITQENKIQKKFYYNCCWKDIHSEGCKSFHHFEKKSKKQLRNHNSTNNQQIKEIDQIDDLRSSKMDKWIFNCNELGRRKQIRRLQGPERK